MRRRTKSMSEPPRLSDERPVSLVPSGLSMKSDWSMSEPPWLSDERPVSLVPSGLSMKSDQSMLEPPKLSSELVDFEPRTQTQRPVSTVPSGLSMPSDQSMLEPAKIASESVPVNPSLAGCNLKAISCEALASTLQAEPSVLRELDLSRNPVQDVGVGHLSSWLGSPNCSLETLRLSDCDITTKGCESLASALSANPSYLRELDLSCNHPGEKGVKILLERKADPNSALKILKFS